MSFRGRDFYSAQKGEMLRLENKGWGEGKSLSGKLLESDREWLGLAWESVI